MSREISLLPLNVQRVIKVLDVAIQKLELLQSMVYLSCHVPFERNQALPSDVQLTLSCYVQLCHIVANNSDDERQNYTSKEVRLRLRRFLGKVISSDMGIPQKIENGFDVARSLGLRVLCQHLKDYGAMIKRIALRTESEYDPANMNQIEDESNSLNERAENLRHEIKSLEEERDFKINCFNSRIRQLDQEIARNEEAASSNIVAADVKMREELLKADKASKQRCRKFEGEIEEMTKQLETLRTDHWQREITIRTAKRTLEKQYEDLKRDFEETLTAKQGIYEELQQEYNRDTEARDRFEKLASILRSKHDAIIEERRRLERDRILQMEELASKTRAAITIQARWRGFMVRSKIKNKGDKRKKKRRKNDAIKTK